MADGLRVLTFCWNTQSLRIGKWPDAGKVELKEEEFDELYGAAMKEGGERVEELNKQASAEADSEGGYFGSALSYLSGASSYAAGMTKSVYGAGESVVNAGYSTTNVVANYIYGDLLPSEFVLELIRVIKREKPDVVAISLEESAKPGDYLMSHIFPDMFSRSGYTLQYRTRFMGAGVSSVKAGVSRGLRLGVFLRQGLSLGGKIVDRKDFGLKEFFQEGSYNCSGVTRGKGGIAIYMNVNGQRLAFIAVHFPHDARSLVEYRSNDLTTYKDAVNRQDSINDINKCFNEVSRNLVFEANVQGAFMMGDFNYRIMAPSARKFSKYMYSSEFNPKWVYNNLDELKSQIDKRSVYQWSEGVNNEGPTFRPTCKMAQGRDYKKCESVVKSGKARGWYRKEGGDEAPKVEGKLNREKRVENDHSDFKIEECYNLGKFDQRNPSWCDRTVYRAVGDEVKIVCVKYDRFDYSGTFSMSDHAGVVGTFDVTV